MTPYIAQITGFGFNFAPKGWAYCAGALMSIQQNQALFSILGTTYGGNGIQTFALPDLRGRVPISWGQGPGLSGYTLGEQSGTQTITVLASQLPLHNHPFSVNTALATSPVPTSNYLAQGAAEGGLNVSMYATGSANAAMAPGTIAAAGGTQPLSIIQPYNVINYSIALNGIFPSRN